MSSFRIDTDSTLSCANELLETSERLRGVANRVTDLSTRTVHTLSRESGQKIGDCLQKMSSVVFAQAARIDSLEGALEYIVRAYIDADQNAISAFRSKTGQGATGGGIDTEQMAKDQERAHDLALQDAVFSLLDTEAYSKEAWNRATIAEREQMLRNLIPQLAAILGIAAPSTIIIDSLESKNIYGYFSEKKDCIALNKDLIEGEAGRELLDTAVHEMRHAYQYQVTQHPERFQVSEETVRQWKDNFEPGHYKEEGEIAPDGHVYTYDEYLAQPIEWDAWFFAGQTTNRHRRIIPDYAGSWQ